MTAPSVPKFAPAPGEYDRRDQQEFRNELERRDGVNLKADRHVQLRKGVAIRVYDTVTGEPYEITVASGALVVTPL